MTDDPLVQALVDALGESAVQLDHPFGAMTTYRVGGLARVFVEPQSIRELASIASVVATHRPRVTVIGRGSNLLVADDRVDALVLHLPEAFANVSVDGFSVEVGAATSLPSLARQLTAAGLAGFEWAVGVPGSVGGAVRMNAGGHGSDMAASLVSVQLVDLYLGETWSTRASDLALGYRSSSVNDHQMVLSASLELEEGDPARGRRILAEIVAWRRDHQPGGQNAGSVFRNPEGDSAGRLIDAAGLRGLRVGTAEVSMKHANFIQADPGGRAADIVALMQEIVRRVIDCSGVALSAETHLVGFDPEVVRSLACPGTPDRELEREEEGCS